MNLALVAVFASAAATGTATVLQARAARQVPTADRLDAGLLVRLVRNRTYLVALVFLATGFALSILALRSLPLFIVQAGRASSLGVTAVLAVVLLKSRLRAPEVVAVLVVAAGLVSLALSAGPERAAAVGIGVRVGLLVAALAVALLAAVVTRRTSGRTSGVLIAFLAGLCFGILALGARILRGFAPPVLLTDPAAYAMAVVGLLGLLLSVTALQRAAVVTVTATMVGTETVVGAALGLILCGDEPGPGRTPYAVAGFGLALAGALALARFGSPAEEAVSRSRDSPR